MGFFPKKAIRVLHVSDLHIGAGSIHDKRLDNDLWNQLWRGDEGAEGARAVDLCVLTGDLAETSPDRRAYMAIAASLNELLGVAQPQPQPRGGSGAETANRTTDKPQENEPSELAGDQRRWIAIPGNHDRKIWGNFGLDRKTFESVFTSWNEPWWHPEYPLVVIPLDSNPDARSGRKIGWAFDLARGCLGRERDRLVDSLRQVDQRIEAAFLKRLERAFAPGARTSADLSPQTVASMALALASAFSPQDIESLYRLQHSGAPRPDAAALPRPDAAALQKLARTLRRQFMARAVKCVLMHHHPIGIANTENLGLTHQDAYLALTDSGDFLQEARRQRISLICHGHKHMPHRLAVQLPGHDVEGVGIVGCGSTTLHQRGGFASANLIEVAPSGQIKVQLLAPRQPAYIAAKEPLLLRTWAAVRAQSSSVAREESRITTKSVDAYADIMATGDALVTRCYRGLSFTAADNSDQVEVPIAVRTTSDLRPPSIDVKGQVGPAVWRETPGESSRARLGFVCFRIAEGTTADLLLRFVSFCAFPTNEWQAKCAYGEAGQPMLEHYTFRSSVPILEDLCVRLSLSEEAAGRGLLFDSPFPYQRNLDNETESEDLRHVSVRPSPTFRELIVAIRQPIWGSTYGVEWRWPAETGGSVFRDDVEQRRRRLEAELQRDASTPISTSLAEALDAVPAGLEACVYLIARGDCTGGTSLRQLAWNERVRARGFDGVSFDFGAGVVGRAAWLRAALGWTLPSRESVEGASFQDSWRNFYVPIGAEPAHVAVAALPLPLPPHETPLAVLSVAASEEASFHNDVRSWITADGGGMPESLGWLRDLAENVAGILARHGG